jgi:predicted DNA-binding protein (UPF0251 family)
MVRPRKNCCVTMDLRVDFFKPRGIPLPYMEQVILEVDELEALRLADFKGLSHKEAGILMNVSRPTFGRILERARKKVADALVHGKAIRIGKGLLSIERIIP